MKLKHHIRTYTSIAYTFCALCIPSLIAEEREWYNADKDKSFLAEYISSTETQVTIFKDSMLVTLDKSILSAEDAQWVSKQPKTDEAAIIAKLSSEPEVLKKVDQFEENLLKNLHQFNGTEYVKHSLKKSPKNYILYFSASW